MAGGGLSERTETSTTWVNKNGSLTTELTAGPVRFQDETTGDWRDVDLDLVSHSDGAVEPKAHPRGLRLAGKTGVPAASLKAGQASKATDLVTLGEGNQQITLQWKGGLPAPKLDGTRAEYVNAVPGADVVVEATVAASSSSSRSSRSLPLATPTRCRFGPEV